MVVGADPERLDISNILRKKFGNFWNTGISLRVPMHRAKLIAGSILDRENVSSNKNNQNGFNTGEIEVDFIKNCKNRWFMNPLFRNEKHFPATSDYNNKHI